MARLYRRTESGREAWDTQDASVSLDYRRVLGLVAQDTDARELRAKLGWSEAALRDVLEELEELGLVEVTAPELDFTGTLHADELDFTGSITVAELRAAARKNK